MLSLSSFKNNHETNYGSLVQAMKQKTTLLDETLETKSRELQKLITQITICASNFQTMQPALKSHTVCEKYHIDLETLRIQMRKEKSFPKALKNFLNREIAIAVQYLTRPPIGRDLDILFELNYPVRAISFNETQLKVSVAWLKTWHDRLKSRFHLFERSCHIAERVFSNAVQLDPQKDLSPSWWSVSYLWAGNKGSESTTLSVDSNTERQRESLELSESPSSTPLLFESQEAEECIEILSKEKIYIAEEATEPLSQDISASAFEEIEFLGNRETRREEEGVSLLPQGDTQMKSLPQTFPRLEALNCELGDALFRNLQFFPVNFSLFKKTNEESLEQIQKIEAKIKQLERENTDENASDLGKTCTGTFPDYHLCSSQTNTLRKHLKIFYPPLEEAKKYIVSQETKETLQGLRFPIKPIEEFEILITKTNEAALQLFDLWRSLVNTRAQFQKTLNNGIYYAKKGKKETHFLEGITSSLSVNYTYFQPAYQEYRIRTYGQEQVTQEDTREAQEALGLFFGAV